MILASLFTTHRFRSHLIDTMCVVWALGFLEARHEYRVLPVLLRWY